MNKIVKPNKRHLSRAFALQALYHQHFSEETPDGLTQEFVNEHAADTDYHKNIDFDFFRILVFGVLKNQAAIDAVITPFLDRPFERLNPVELAILRLGVYELRFHPETPQKVIINEAIELAKAFGAEDGYKYVNAVLNAVVKGNSASDDD